MSLRELAESDLKHILEDTLGFGWPITVVDPAGLESSYTGYSNDIADLIDPNTGTSVTGRRASVALRISSIVGDLPRGVAAASKKPWLVKFKDVPCNDYQFKVIQSNPDRGLGVITLLLEGYKNA